MDKVNAINVLKPAESTFWQQYLRMCGRSESQVLNVSASMPGNSQIADNLVALYLAGKKTAGSGLVKDYELHGDALPQVGDFWIILDSQEKPRCIVETERVEVCPFDEVTEEIALAEGEGDSSVHYWNEAHRDFFRPFLKEFGIANLDKELVVTEFFRLVFPVERVDATDQVLVLSENFESAAARALIEALNAELRGRYPEEGATHFQLDSREVAPGQGRFLVAYSNGEPAGCGAIRRVEENTGEIKRMYVATKFRGRGIGKTLLSALEEEARTLGIKRLVLETGERQLEALSLYRASGFTQIPRFGEYKGSPLSICMGKGMPVHRAAECSVSSIREIDPADTLNLNQLGKFRLDVWRQEAVVNEALFPSGMWIEALDHKARHWIATDLSGITAAARLTIHSDLLDNPDGYLFDRAKLQVELPCAHLCKLVVHPRARGQGIASELNKIRIEAARAMGAKSILVTASGKNTRLLKKLGFVDTGIRETFPNRPGYEFAAMQKDL